MSNDIRALAPIRPDCLRVLVEKPNGFVGSQLVAALEKQSVTWSIAGASARRNGPQVLLLNRWGSVPSTTAACPITELSVSLVPLLQRTAPSDLLEVSHVVFLSSAGALYAPSSQAADEQTLPRPSSNYGAGKLAAEAFLSVAAASARVPLTILRPSNLYGPGQAPRTGFGIVPAIHAALAGGEPVRLWPGSEVRKDYLYIDDCTDALTRVLLSEPPPAGLPKVLNVASGHCINVSELISTAEQIQGQPCPTTGDAVRLASANLAIAPDAREFRELYQWQPRIDIRHGLRATFDWLDRRNR